VAIRPRTSKSKSRRLSMIRRRLLNDQESPTPDTLTSLGGSSDPDHPSPGRHPHPSFYILPNLFTSCSLFLSLFSIVKAAEGDFIMACWLILGAALCDVIDGPVARLTNTASNFGLQYDSLADVVAFGVAPSFLMFRALHDINAETMPSYAPKLALGACALYAICAAIRLARFNVQAATEERKMFKGLPSPGAAGGVVSAYLLIDWLNKLPIMEGVSSEWWGINLHRLVLLLMVGLALVMVSDIPFPKLKNLLKVSGNPINALVWIVGIFCVIITLQEFLPLLLFVAFMIYTLGSILVATRQRVKKTEKPL
jgi:CDP-diacylglycerol---serine O-phosphatidyltransferase